MKSWLRNPFFILALVLCWRVWLLVFTVQPIPGNDAFGYDGGVVNLLNGGHYINPSFALVFPITGKQIYATYPPLYQAALFAWMKLFGATAVSAMALHLVMFAISGLLTLMVVRKFFPASTGYALLALLLLGFTFDDRPEGLAYIFGLGALWLVGRQISSASFDWRIAGALALALWFTLYTSVIVGAYFFGAGFLACAVACLGRRRWGWFVPFVAAALLFAAVTLAIVQFEPLWWAGFLESARQQSVMTSGFHAPQGADLLKLIRSVPVFLLGLALLPWLVARRRELFSRPAPWLALSAGIFVMGWILLAASLTLLASNYVMYATLTQIILAAGLLAVCREQTPAWERALRAGLVACVCLVSIRAAGMSTWGAACAWKNSYTDTQAVLRQELQPFVTSDRPVLVSSAFLYCAAGVGVKNPVHSDWYFDHAQWTNNAQFNALARLQPPRLVLTQFDYYRGFVSPLEALRQHPELVEIRVRDLAGVRPPDASPWLQRVLQHVSWAPVIVDLDWKTPAAGQ